MITDWPTGQVFSIVDCVPPAVPREVLRAQLLELVGEIFDQLVPGDPRRLTIGEQAERRRRRERFQQLVLELGRQLVRIARTHS